MIKVCQPDEEGDLRVCFPNNKHGYVISPAHKNKATFSHYRAKNKFKIVDMRSWQQRDYFIQFEFDTADAAIAFFALNASRRG